MFFYRFCLFFIGFPRSLSPLCFFGFFLGLFHPLGEFFKYFSFPFSAFEFSRLFFARPSPPFLFVHTFPSFRFVAFFLFFLFCPLSARPLFVLSADFMPVSRLRFLSAPLRASPRLFRFLCPVFTLLRFLSRSSPLSDFPAVPLSPHPCPLLTPFLRLFPTPSLLRSLFFRPPAFSPSRIFPLPFSPFLSVSLVPSPFYSSFSPSPLLCSVPVRFPLFSAFPSPTPSLLRLPLTHPLSSPSPHLSPPSALRVSSALCTRFPSSPRPVDRARLLCYNTFR